MVAKRDINKQINLKYVTKNGPVVEKNKID